MSDTTAPGYPVADELAAVLNRAASRHIAVCPYVDRDGALYSVEWVENGELMSLTVEWDMGERQWIITDGSGE